MRRSLAAFAVTAALLAAPAAFAADLVVKVLGVQPDAGDIRIVIIADPDGMARQNDSKNLKAKAAADGSVSARFLGVSPGTYGVVATHDRHVNHAFEKSVTGVISSPISTSGQVKVVVAEPATTVTLTLP
jgi:uncharacterized protein (DUF2141 family)